MYECCKVPTNLETFHDVGSRMCSGTTLLLLLPVRPQNPTTTKIGNRKTSQCGDLPVGVTIEKREFDLAGMKLEQK